MDEKYLNNEVCHIGIKKMTPDKNFRMKKSTKYVMASLKTNDTYRAEFKKSMIDAQLCEEAARRQALRSKAKDVD